ncbi:MAG: DNA-protecting protein DprA [Gaiellales bacterium]|nr:DNA-protecting protein DprA [Gaiellales bacterium]
MSGEPDEPEAALGLACVVGLGSSPVLELLRWHLSGDIWRASAARLERWGLSRPVAARFVARRRAWRAQPVRERMEETGVRFVPLSELGTAARCLAVPPAGAFLVGEEETWRAIMTRPRVTIVGTRRSTPYGRALARAAAGRFVGAGVAVVSGLAFGVDVEAHKGALATGGLTLAVLGCGPNVTYPRAHAAIREKVRGQGVILSEYPPDTPPAPWRFPARNRIMAALGDAVLVVEAGERSGALITVDEALSLGRSVLAVPGPLGSEASRGCHRLIADGAAIVESLDLLVKEYACRSRTDREGRGLCLSPSFAVLRGTEAEGRSGTVERFIQEALAQGPCSVDQLAQAAAGGVREVSAALALMELRGEVVRAGTGVYALNP